jgi:hypothetical protein
MANSTTLYRAQDGRTWVDVTENKTLALADCGIVQNVLTDAITVTLPATAGGLQFTVRNGGVAPSGAPAGAVSDASNLVTVAPNASDQISGLAFTPADNKAALNTKATARVGDEITLLNDGAVGNGWVIASTKGVWARAA